MKKTIISSLFAILLFSTCTKSECELKVGEVIDKRTQYLSNKTDENCKIYENALLDFLGFTCEYSRNVDWNLIFNQELNQLPCYEYNTIVDVCEEGFNEILKTGKIYNANNTKQNCEIYKSNLKKYIDYNCSFSNEYQEQFDILICQ